MNIKEYINNYLLHIKIVKNYSPRTVKSYTVWLSIFSQWCDSQNITNLEELTLDHILHYQHYLTTRNYLNIPLSPASQAIYVKCVRVMLHYYYRKFQGTKIINPYFIEVPKVTRKQIQYLTSEQVDLLSKAVNTKRFSGKRDRAIIEVLFSTGMRVSEMLSLNRRDINYQNKSLTITGKGGKTRLVFMSNEALFYLNEYIAAREDTLTPLFAKILVGNRIPPENNCRLGILSVEQNIAFYGQVAKIPFRVHPHMLRHAFATDLLRNGAPLQNVQKLLGHANIATTEIYTHVTDNDSQEIFKKYHTKRNITL